MSVFLALLFLQAAAPDAYTIEAAARDLPAEGGNPPAILVEGTSNLPEGTRIDVDASFFFKKAERLISRNTHVSKGRFLFRLPIFAERNLAGRYVINVRFYPDLQLNPEIRRTLGADCKLINKKFMFEIGDEKVAKEDQRRVYGRLADEFRALAAIAEEINARSNNPPRGTDGKFDNGAWKKLTGEWNLRAKNIMNRNIRVTEYRAFGLHDFVLDTTECLCGSIHQLALFTEYALLKPEDLHGAALFQQVRLRFNQTIQESLESVNLSTPTREEMLSMVEDIRQGLHAAPGLSGGPLKEARDRFRKAVLRLDASVPPLLHEPVARLAGDSASFFEAVEGKTKEVAPMLDRLDRHVAELNRLLKESP